MAKVRGSEPHLIRSEVKWSQERGADFTPLLFPSISISPLSVTINAGAFNCLVPMPSTIALQPQAKELIPTHYYEILQEIYYFYWIIVLSDPTLPSVLSEKEVGKREDILFKNYIAPNSSRISVATIFMPSQYHNHLQELYLKSYKKKLTYFSLFQHSLTGCQLFKRIWKALWWHSCPNPCIPVLSYKNVFQTQQILGFISS